MAVQARRIVIVGAIVVVASLVLAPAFGTVLALPKAASDPPQPGARALDRVSRAEYATLAPMKGAWVVSRVSYSIELTRAGARLAVSTVESSRASSASQARAAFDAANARAHAATADALSRAGATAPPDAPIYGASFAKSMQSIAGRADPAASLVECRAEANAACARVVAAVKSVVVAR